MNRLSLLIAVSVTVLALLLAALTLGPGLLPAKTAGGDKLQHALGFGSLVAPAALFRPRWLWTLVPAAVVFGGVIELVQPFTGRDGDLLDWVADIAGIVSVALGLSLAREVAIAARRRLASVPIRRPPLAKGGGPHRSSSP